MLRDELIIQIYLIILNADFFFLSVGINHKLEETTFYVEIIDKGR